ncbi:histidinol-phosphatase HisJ family protein [Erysipelothrix anatis]|uniref:histidinol-phosphatase HisJ family protein n=1 Tax=Erysipelothrix anatis TaxID=2683713 RepID=UPI00140D5999|nr:histidinol-phosphatase HisJ family protein [Erysipelothrix anatis]
MKIDYHVHSDYSDDSWYLMRDVVIDAIDKGINEICFTEHVDYGVKEDWNSGDVYKPGKNKIVRNVNYPLYFDEIEALRSEFSKEICIKVGMEFGIQKQTVKEFEKLYNSYPFDFILLSIHQIENKEFWTGEFQKDKTDEECYEAYYKEMYWLVRNFKNYSCLAHMDLIRRYLDKNVDMFEYCEGFITEILKQVISDGKGIEVNTSSFRYEINGLTPSIKILKLYYDLGGTVITIGSDSHKKEHLGFNIEESKLILKEIGFTHYCTFSKMKPIYHEL